MARRVVTLAGLLLVALAAVPPVSGQTPTLVVYSGRTEPLILPVIQAFRGATGIQVAVRSGGAAELANVILEERNSPRADLFISNDAGTLEALRIAGTLQPYASEATRRIPAEFRARDGTWVGASGRSRVIMYNTNLVAEAGLPRSVLDLTQRGWKGRLAMATTRNESVVAWVTALRLVRGERATREFLASLLANGIVFLPGHTQVRQAVGRGEFALGLVNHYYYHLQLAEGSPVGVIYPDQGPNQMGVMVNVAGVGIIRGARNAAAAQRFVDFVVSARAQNLFARTNFEYPLLEGVPPAPGVRPLDSFRRTPLQLDRLGAELDRTLKLIEELGLQ